MSSTLQGKSDSPKRLVSDAEALVIPENARPTDESPTVISKTPPLVHPAPSSSQQKIVDLARKHATPESIVASLRGRRLAHYELIEPIGVGGMAAVIRARDTQLDRFVALKILPPEAAQEPENVQRFHQEAKAAAKLDHENVARVFFCGEDQGLHFIAFEFVEGITLRTMLEQRGRLPVAEAVRYVLQIAAGLEHAATRGVVHRDVKPSNVIITPTGRAKLVDMGLARNLERHGDDLTQSGVTLGTFDYISPEQALEPRDADTRSDIYSLGCTFYHLLTGQPPVPEGTPAKKLQHHQHGQPLDPRAIDPAIPDEIVLILDKMLAKQPKDRYQRPIHLLHQLLPLAKKVGAADDIPEGLLLVDAPLPNQPRHRPLLLIGMSLAALVVVTLLLSLAPEPVRNVPKGTPEKSGADNVGPLPIKDRGLTPAKGNGPVDNALPAVVKDASGLESVLKEPAKDVRAPISLYKGIDLVNTGLVYHGGAEQTLRLEPDEPEGHANVRFQYDKDDGSEAGLVLDGGKELVFKRIRFQIDSKGTPEKAVAAVMIRGVQSVTFEQCIFAQAVPNFSNNPAKTRIASILIDTAEIEGARPPIVNLRECYFDGGPTGGQVAVAINGPATVNVINCAFRPHNAFFQLRKNCTLERTAVNMQQNAGFVVYGPAFRFDDKAAAHLDVRNSVFSRPGIVVGASEPDLISLPETATLKFVGDHNLYHNLNAYVGKEIYGADFQKFLAKKGSDQNAKYLDQIGAPSPWQQPDPLNYAGVRLDLAFQLKADFPLAEFGLKKSWLGDMPPAPAVNLAKPAPATKIKKIVDGDDVSGMAGVFKTLAGALGEATDGDVIFVRHGDNRDVIVPPMLLKPGINVTLKADKTPEFTYQPRLILDKNFKDNVASVFKLQEGKLEIEGMEIVLDPDKDKDVTQSIVQIGGAHCIFKKCVFTMRAPNGENLSVVSSIDVSSMMKGEMPNGSSGRVEFHDCFVRGKGDLVALNGCRLLNVEMEDSLVALDGQLLDLTPASKPMPMNQGVRWKMNGSSIFTTDSVFALRFKFGDVLTETQAEVEGCLLGSLKPGKSVVNLGGDQEFSEKLKWKGERNFYADFDKPNEWRDKFDTKSELGMLTLPKLTDKNLETLWDAMPDWFKPADAEQERLIKGFGQTAEAQKRSLQALADPDEP